MDVLDHRTERTVPSTQAHARRRRLATLVIVAVALASAAIWTRTRAAPSVGAPGLDVPAWQALGADRIDEVSARATGESWAVLSIGRDLPDPRRRTEPGVVDARLAVSPSGHVAIALSEVVVVLDPATRSDRRVPTGAERPSAVAIDDVGAVWLLVDHPRMGPLVERHAADGTITHAQLPAALRHADLTVTDDAVHVVSDAQIPSARSLLVGDAQGLRPDLRSALLSAGVPGGWRVSVGFRTDDAGVLGFGARHVWDVEIGDGDAGWGVPLRIGEHVESSVTTLGLGVDGSWLAMLTLAGTDCPAWIVDVGPGAADARGTCLADASAEAASRGMAPYTATDTHLWWLVSTDEGVEIRRLALP